MRKTRFDRHPSRNSFLGRNLRVSAGKTFSCPWTAYAHTQPRALFLDLTRTFFVALEIRTETFFDRIANLSF